MAGYGYQITSKNEAYICNAVQDSRLFHDPSVKSTQKQKFDSIHKWQTKNKKKVLIRCQAARLRGGWPAKSFQVDKAERSKQSDHNSYQ